RRLIVFFTVSISEVSMFRHALTVTLSLLSLPLLAADDLVIADFEGGTYNGWTSEGTAFGTAPAKGTLPGQKPVSGFLGKGLINTFIDGDRSTGRLQSPTFVVARQFITFMIGGGDHAQKCAINLLANSKVVRSATGSSRTGDDGEGLEWRSWNVAELMGSTVTIEIIDRATGGWGHILVDHIVQSDHERKADQPAERAFRLSERYLAIPVKTGAPKRTMTLMVDGVLQREFVVELASGQPDFWTGCDVTAYHGKDAVLRIAKLDADSTGWAAIAPAASIPGNEQVYQEERRPQFHFSAQRGWLNDPNGLVFEGGEYHLYFQHNPFGIAWENMHWGHAVSRDLVHWQELSPVLWRRHAFSGSAAIDHANSGGFQSGKEPALIAAWTSTDRGECIAYSNDHGRTYTEIPQNPVVKHSGRDPRIFWHAASKQWVMALYDESDGKRWITIQTSINLKQWTYRSRVEGFFECPDLYELPVDGDSANTRWVITAANGHYLLGRFDGTTFTPDQSTQSVFPAVGNIYAAQTYNDVPDARRIHVGWFQTNLSGMPFNQSMSFPNELSLRATGQGIRLCANPVREIATLYQKTDRIPVTRVKPGEDPLAALSGELLDVRGAFTIPDQGKLTLTLRGIAISYDAAKQQLTCDGKTTPLALTNGKLALRVLVDRASVEIYADDGVVYMPLAITVPAQDHSLHLAVNTDTAITTLEIATLKSAWVTPH
ncbi:MAG TPA: glycoside hydrolase family 32 protein, partial [Planctomycetota bacterium]|nr:glycoside hydrolase family 32 protein [Planctomycetota bacterium]